MAEALNEIAELSRMKWELNNQTLEALKGPTGKYADRLEVVADKTFGRGQHVRGTTILRPSMLTHGRKGRLAEVTMPKGFGMYTRNISTPEGKLIMFPLHTVGLAREGAPIIDPDIEGSYTVVHSPTYLESDLHNPIGMRVDLAFTVDKDNLVTVNGTQTATIQEAELFDAIVNEFERLADL